MSTTRVNEMVARPIRSTTQATIAFAIVEFWDSFIQDLTEKQYGAAVGLLVIVLAFLNIVLERALGFTFLRQEPPGDVPVKDDTDDSGLQR